MKTGYVILGILATALIIYVWDRVENQPPKVKSLNNAIEYVSVSKEKEQAIKKAVDSFKLDTTDVCVLRELLLYK